MSDEIFYSVWKRYTGGVSFEDAAENAGVDEDALEDCSERQKAKIVDEIQTASEIEYPADRLTDSESPTVYGPDGTPLV